MVLFKAACLEADIINENNRIYSYETMNNINSSIQQSIKEGNIKQVIKNHTKEYRELLIKETQQFHNSKEIVEHYINQYSK